jgi:hypothetical protein
LVLKRDKVDVMNDNWIDVTSAITEAIRCVELLPELVEALEIANKMMFGLDTENCYIDVFNDNRELLKKAKGEA